MGAALWSLKPFQKSWGLCVAEEQQEETTHCPTPLLMEDSECLAEEAEELGMGVEECEVMAVQTRAQKKKEQECIRKDDEASALSGATPIDLPQSIHCKNAGPLVR